MNGLVNTAKSSKFSTIETQSPIAEIMAENSTYLPEECWELIFNRLDRHSDFEPLSLVCKQFLSLTNRLQSTLIVVYPTIIIHGTISNLIHRFQHLKTLDFCEFHGDINSVILGIVNSSLRRLETIDISSHKNIPTKALERLGSKINGLKVLKCSNLGTLFDSDLVWIANSLRNLEELDISYPWNNYDQSSILTETVVSDAGIKVLSSNLKNLRKINLSGNDFISDLSLTFLSSNCVLFEEIELMDCSFITPKGVQAVLQKSCNLTKLNLSGIQISHIVPLFQVSFFNARALSTIEFYDLIISDEFLYSLAKACFPLKRLLLSWCSSFTFSGISLLLSTYRSLEHLGLVKVEFLTDHSVHDLSQYLQKLASIKLNLCPQLTCSTLVTLVQNFPLLHDIEMERTKLDKGDWFVDFVKNPRIKSLSTRNSSLQNICLEKLVSLCPNLELLDVSNCSGITGSGIAEFLKGCRGITHLRIKELYYARDVERSEVFILSEWETLSARMCGIDDEFLATIGERCWSLDLSYCRRLTTGGVRKVVKNSVNLRDINLEGCDNVDSSIVEWMVFSRSLLRKIIPPSYSSFTESQRNLFWRHGCQLYES